MRDLVNSFSALRDNVELQRQEFAQIRDMAADNNARWRRAQETAHKLGVSVTGLLEQMYEGGE